MTLPREEVVPGLLVEFAEFEALVRSLDESELARAEPVRRMVRR